VSRFTRRQLVQGAGVAGLLAGCGRLPWQTPAPTKVYRVGYLGTDPTAPEHEAFREGLQEYGYVEGQNLAVEYRWADRAAPSEERSASARFAAELVALPVDVIVAGGSTAGMGAREATSVVPIVLTRAADAVATGLVASLARPGANVTGLSSITPLLNAKNLELLHAMVPQLSRIALLRVDAPAGGVFEEQAWAAAQALGIDLLTFAVRNADDVEAALNGAVRWHTEALWADGSALVVSMRAKIVEVAAQHGVPVVAQPRAFVEVGGLMAYGASRIGMARRAAYYVDRILKGAKPADLPVEQPREFDFIINLKTAQTLGLTIPPHVLLQATEVIQ
jgi:putative tryptophan/tyrosine transport system substrate-binding protein